MTQYEIDRNSLIDIAEKHVNKLVGNIKTRKIADLEQWKGVWDRLYLAEMDRLYNTKFGGQQI